MQRLPLRRNRHQHPSTTAEESIITDSPNAPTNGTTSVELPTTTEIPVPPTDITTDTPTITTTKIPIGGNGTTTVITTTPTRNGTDTMTLVTETSTTKTTKTKVSTETTSPGSQDEEMSTSTTTSTTISVVDTLTWVPTSLIVEITLSTSTPTGTRSKTTPTPSQTGIPDTLPKIIMPDTGIPKEPEGSTLIRIGFDSGLNYPFLVRKPVAVAQIFKYLPKGLSHGLQIPVYNVTMHSLQPYDSRDTVGFIRAIALCYIPVDLVDKLRVNLLTPNSRLYRNPDPTTEALMYMIDPSIPLLATESMDGLNEVIGGDDGSWLGDGNNNEGTKDKNQDKEDDGSLLGGSDDEDTGTSQVMGKSVGIGVGVVLGAAVYGAAMFFVARRYRQRRLRHGRASSISRSISPGSNPAGALMGGAMMSGARTDAEKRGSNGSGGRISARGQTISGPMQAENSLGWN
ncbi:hypothetical protein BDZ91DRAFT_772397 [Kalaharituber pfeilii]|nr:hypothetical protein BDZ91DRAFT_772397 [Kalaharituber pfeilii]